MSIIKSDDSAFFPQLIASLQRRLRHLSRVTQGEHSIDDLKQEAWFVARDLQDAAAKNLDPLEKSVQDSVMTTLYKKFGRFVDRHLRFATRLDEELRDHDGASKPNSTARSLAVSATQEPQAIFESSADDAALEKLLKRRYAEAIAYIYSLQQFDGKKKLAAHLAVTEPVLNGRLRKAEHQAVNQPSLFDGIESIPSDFMPRAGHPRATTRGSKRNWISVCGWLPGRQFHLFFSEGRVWR